MHVNNHELIFAIDLNCDTAVMKFSSWHSRYLSLHNKRISFVGGLMYYSTYLQDLLYYLNNEKSFLAGVPIYESKPWMTAEFVLFNLLIKLYLNATGQRKLKLRK